MAPLTLLTRASGGYHGEHLTMKNGGTGAAIGLVILIIGVTAIAAVGGCYLKRHWRTQRENAETAAVNCQAEALTAAVMNGESGVDRDGFESVPLHCPSSSDGESSSKGKSEASSGRTWYGKKIRARESEEGIEMV